MKWIEPIIRKEEWPILHYSMGIALPYVFIGLLFGFLYRWDLVHGLGEAGNYIMFVLSPVAGQIVSYTGSTPWDAVSLSFNIVVTLFLSWLFIAPIVGLFRAIRNI